MPFRWIIDALTEYQSRQQSTHKTPLCVTPGDPFILCPPYVNSDLWIISFKEEVTTSTSRDIILQMKDLTHSPVVHRDYNRNIPPHHIVYIVTCWVILGQKCCSHNHQNAPAFTIKRVFYLKLPELLLFVLSCGLTTTKLDSFALHAGLPGHLRRQSVLNSGDL